MLISYNIGLLLETEQMHTQHQMDFLVGLIYMDIEETFSAFVDHLACGLSAIKISYSLGYIMSTLPTRGPQ